MQTIRPLTRNVRSKIVPATSSIPHISYHLRCRSKQARRIDLCHRQRAQPQRCQSTFLNPSNLNIAQSPAEDNESPYFTPDSPRLNRAESNSAAHGLSDLHTGSSAVAAEQKESVVDAARESKSSLHQTTVTADLLAEANPERIFAWLQFHPAGRTFINAATDPEFEIAFCAINLNVLLEPFKEALWHARGQGVGGEELQYDKSIIERCRSLAQSIDNILLIRQDAEHSLTLSVCRHALKCAAFIGDVRMAKQIWEEIMPLYSLKPDITCYNAYMEAHAWNLGFGQAARHAFRATKHVLSLRSKVSRPKHLWGFSVSLNEGNHGQTLKGSVLALFQGISHRGLSPTEDTFTALMISLARSGDINGPQSILKSVWNIDVEQLDSFDEEEVQSPTFYPEDHPLRPSAKLLWAVVHCYGVTSNGHKARSLLDYISRNYALEIPSHVWNELIERTYVLSRNWTSTRRAQGYADGHIAQVEVEKLYKVLTDEPYSLAPTPIISNLLTRTYQSRGLRAKTLQQLREDEKALKAQVQSLKFMNEAFQDLSQHTTALLDNGILSEPFLNLRQKFQIIYLDVRLRLDLLTKQVQRVISKADFVGSGRNLSWERQELPTFIGQMASYIHNQTEYTMRTGKMRLQLRPSKTDRLWENEIYEPLYEAHVIWQALKSNNLFEVASELGQLPQSLESARRTARSKREGALKYKPLSNFEVQQNGE